MIMFILVPKYKLLLLFPLSTNNTVYTAVRLISTIISEMCSVKLLMVLKAHQSHYKSVCLCSHLYICVRAQEAFVAFISTDLHRHSFI